jgi:hypothetical protein
MVSLKICVNIQLNLKSAKQVVCKHIYTIHTLHIHTQKYIHTCTIYTHLTHMIYHVVMEIGLGIKQSKHVYTTG